MKRFNDRDSKKESPRFLTVFLKEQRLGSRDRGKRRGRGRRESDSVNLFGSWGWVDEAS